MTNPTELLRCLRWSLSFPEMWAMPTRYSEIPFNYEIGWNDFLTVPVMKLLQLKQSLLMQR
ncbi:MAG: hypothetical protein V7K48_22910 [Nostoc sp.]|uniref:hypothetical protein n=1 Tax=Nostoc sp. TaxID=1180 RepID=UPI002FFD2CD0